MERLEHEAALSNQDQLAETQSGFKAMRNWNSPLRAATFILGVLLSASASAAPITWGPPQDTTGPGDINTFETLIEAVNLTPGNLVPGTTVVNGVEFVHDDTLMGLLGGVGLLEGNTTGDADYDALLDSLDHGDTSIANPWPIQVGGGNLGIGSGYELQLWYSDLRSFAGSGWTQVYDDGSGNTVTLDAAGNGGLGQFVLGTFTADAPTQTLIIAGGNPPGEPHLTAYQVRLTDIGTPIDPGDADGNGVVDELDLDILLANFYITNPRPSFLQGNFNNDLTVDESDFVIWRAEFLDAGGSLAGLHIAFPTAPVPEPSSCVLVVLASLLWGRIRCR
jgi:hypothetical protein